MPSIGLRMRRGLQGVAFLVVVAALITLTIVIYNKALPWQSSDRVFLQAGRIGNELNVPSDVKYDGVLVGRVSAVKSNGQQATLTLQLDPSVIDNDRIPSNVQAEILPKTLFGEKYVQLVQPRQPSSRPLQIDDVIQQDRSKTAIELQTVFNNLVPLLNALNPAQLSITLTSVADTLRGRGDELGQNLVLAEQYFRRFNRDLPNLNHDISALATLADNYSQASPDLLATLRNLSVTAQTFAEKQSSYLKFLSNSQGVANAASNVFGQNAQRIIDINRVSRPVTALYARNSIVLECMPNGLAIYDRSRLEGIFGPSSTNPNSPNSSPPGGVPAIHIALIPVGDRGTYTSKPSHEEDSNIPDYSRLKNPQEKSRMLCRGLPYGNHPLQPHFDKVPVYKGGPSGNYNLGGISTPALPGVSTAAKTSSKKGSSGHAHELSATPGTNGAGSNGEQRTLRSMLSALGGGQNASNLGLEDLLLGPMLRGMMVVPS